MNGTFATMRSEWDNDDDDDDVIDKFGHHDNCDVNGKIEEPSEN